MLKKCEKITKSRMVRKARKNKLLGRKSDGQDDAGQIKMPKKSNKKITNAEIKFKIPKEI